MDQSLVKLNETMSHVSSEESLTEFQLATSYELK